MITYFTTQIILISSAWLGRNGQAIQRLLYWVILAGLSIFVGFRLNVGCDFDAYLLHFSYGTERAFEKVFTSLDPGHWLLISFLNYLELHPQSLNVVASILFFTGLHSLARLQPDRLAFLVLCFPILIINMPMAAVRQSVAIGFMCLALAAFINRRSFLFLTWIFIGSTFHSSILVFLSIFPFLNRRLSIPNIGIALAFAAPIIFVILQTEAAQLAATRYIEGGSQSQGAIYRLSMLALTSFYFLFRLAPLWKKQFPFDYNFYLLGAWMMLASLSLLFVSTVIADRFGYYLIPIQAMLFARIPYLDLGRFRQIHAFLPYALLTIVFIFWAQSSWHFQECYVPYNFGFGS